MTNNCWICGKQDSTLFRCRFCGKTFCVEHRLPERHACEGLEYQKKHGFTGASSVGGNYSNFDTEGIFKNMFKETAKQASKGIAFGFLNKIKRWATTSPTMAIIIICTISYIIGNLIIANIFDINYFGFLGLPADISLIFLKPWTIITHMFVHSNLAHLFLNMFVLFFFGNEFEKRFGKQMFLRVFFITGIAASLGFALTTTSPFPLVGASGAVIGVFAALAVLEPNLPIFVFFIPMKIKHAIVLLIGIEFLFFAIAVQDMIAHNAHLMGMVVGILMGYWIKNTKPRFRTNTKREYVRRW